MKISVIIPVFNEVKTVEEIIKKIESLNIDKEIIAVDDGSNDGSAEVLKKLYGEGEIKLIIHKKNLGKGAAIKSGLAAAKGDIIVIQDADLETNPQDILRLIKPIEESKTRVVFGFRDSNNLRSIYWWGGKTISLITRLLYGGNIGDVNNGYKVMTRELWDSLNLTSNRFQICEEITTKLLKRKEKIIQIQTQYSPRTKKQGKKLGLVDGFISIWTLLKYRFVD